MAQRPWVTPEQVKGYTSSPKVSARSAGNLLIDITRAEAYIIARVNHDFSDSAKYSAIPPEIATATIIVAEHYALKAVTAPTERVKSETFKDHSWTLDDSGPKNADELDINALLEPHIRAASVGTIEFKMRRL